jgi:hypothetical protein
MFNRITVALGLAAALCLAPMRLPAQSCILSNMPSEKACQPGCCANKTCCAVSEENTAPAAQPLAKNDSAAKLTATSPILALAVSPNLAPASPQVASPIVDASAHSPPTLALICIRLI